MSYDETVKILLVEDNPGDIVLMREALKAVKARSNLHVVTDGQQAMDFLRNGPSNPAKVRPGLVLLDLNLPKKDGREVLRDIKADKRLRSIPTVVVTNSVDESDIKQAYDSQANCYITKPVDFAQLKDAVRTLEAFWLKVAQLPAGA